MSSDNWEYHNFGPVCTRIILNRTKHNFGSKQKLRFSLIRKSLAAKTEVHMLGAVKVILLVFFMKMWNVIAYLTTSHGIWTFIPHRREQIPRSEAEWNT